MWKWFAKGVLWIVKKEAVRDVLVSVLAEHLKPKPMTAQPAEPEAIEEPAP